MTRFIVSYMVGEYRNDPGYEPEGQGTPSGSHAEGGSLSPDIPLGALSLSFIFGALIAAASGYGWYGILCVGFLAVLICGVINIFRLAHAAHVRRKTWWMERDQ